MFEILITIIGLSIFEIMNSVDNAIVNAEALSTMSKKARSWFLIWGVMFAVFVIRGLLPWLLLFISDPSINFSVSLSLLLHPNVTVEQVVKIAAPRLLLGSGIFLFLLFLKWIFFEKKNIILPHEAYLHGNKKVLYIVLLVFLIFISVRILYIDHFLFLSTLLGSVLYVCIHFLRQKAEKMEKLTKGNLKESDSQRILYLIVLDAIFSLDGVLGAFAFTLSIPLILIGNGLGAIVVSQLTVRNRKRLQSFAYLKNGAMYSIGCLSLVMIGEGLHINLPTWISPLVTMSIILYFYYRSKN